MEDDDSGPAVLCVAVMCSDLLSLNHKLYECGGKGFFEGSINATWLGGNWDKMSLSCCIIDTVLMVIL